MTIKGYAEATKKSYLYRLQLFALHFKRCPSTLDESHVIEYLRFLAVDKQASQSTLSATYSAIKILFVHVLGRTWNSVHLPRPKRKKVLPVVLSQKQVQALFDITPNVKHRSLLMLVYCAGLRVSEAKQMRVCDILFSRKMVFVRQAKGAKDRYSILSNTLIEQLRSYLKIYRPHYWLFNGQHPTQPISVRTIGAVYKQAKQKAGIAQAGGIHQLRHSFATHMLEAGMNIFALQRLLGHTSLRTTARYVHLTDSDFSDFTHPLDSGL